VTVQRVNITEENYSLKNTARLIWCILLICKRVKAAISCILPNIMTIRSGIEILRRLKIVTSRSNSTQGVRHYLAYESIQIETNSNKVLGIIWPMRVYRFKKQIYSSSCLLNINYS